MAKTANKGTATAKPKEKKLPQKKVRVRNQVKKGPHGGTLVVLVDDTAHVGKQGEIVEVKAGYARNYLIPYGKAVIPSAENLRTLDQYKIKVEKAREAKIADLKVLAEQLTRLPAVTIEANATDDDHLYGSIGPAEISKLLKGKNLGIEPAMVKLDHPIKEANTISDVPLNLGYGIESKIQLIVVGIKQGAGGKK